MTGIVRFIYNPIFEGELRVSAAVLGILEEKGKRVVEAAKGFAPVLQEPDPRYFAGEARESIHVILGVAHAYVVMDPPRDDGLSYGAFIEFGTEDTPVYAPLRKGLEVLSAK